MSIHIPGEPGNIFLSSKNRNALNLSYNKKFFEKKFIKSNSSILKNKRSEAIGDKKSQKKGKNDPISVRLCEIM